jgi:hypothetical protein
MGTILKRVAIAVAATVGALLYVWIAAVRAVPGVRRRKAEARARRRAETTPRPRQ